MRPSRRVTTSGVRVFTTDQGPDQVAASKLLQTDVEESVSGVWRMSSTEWSSSRFRSCTMASTSVRSQRLSTCG